MNLEAAPAPSVPAARGDAGFSPLELSRLKMLALDAQAAAMVITDLDGAVLWANNAFSLLTGYGVEGALGRNLRFLNSGRHPAEFFREMWESILAGCVWRGDVV